VREVEHLRSQFREVEKAREELRAENEELKAEASLVSAWDDPEFKFTNVNKKTFRNESVPLDGRLYTNCTFINVTFVYKGEQPYGLVAYKILGKDTALKTEGAPLWAYLRLLNVLGYIKQGVEKGDELRPDATGVRIEDGEVEIFESKEEEDQRIRRENEQLKAEKDA
jgi:FtsZ-binding cell division protein ZapB